LAGKRLAETDRNLPLLVWYGLEPLVESQAAAVLELARNSGLPNLHRFVVRRLSESEAGRSSLVRFYAQADRANHWPLLLEELDAAATARAGVEMPAEWPKLRRMLEQADNGRVVQLARSVAVQFGDQSVFPHFRAVLTNRQAPRQQRLDALAALRTAKDPQLGQHLHDVLADPELASSAAAALAEFGNAKTPEVLISRFADFNDKTRTSALSTLVSRKKDARALAAAMETGQIPPSEVPAFIVRQALALEDDKLNTQLEQVWGKINVSSEEMRSQYEKYRKLLTPRSIAGADASRGRALYKANCGNCHKLFGSGGEIGPEITGANRNQRDYWLENILEPNALIGRAYQVTSLLTADGRVISGIIETENDQAVTIQTATEKLVVAQEDIEQRKSSEASLMPAGQLETLTPDQVRDLFKYLMGPSQVPLPKPAES
jgi:putative heme-binding domain-containing protein